MLSLLPTAVSPLISRTGRSLPLLFSLLFLLSPSMGREGGAKCVRPLEYGAGAKAGAGAGVDAASGAGKSLSSLLSLVLTSFSPPVTTCSSGAEAGGAVAVAVSAAVAGASPRKRASAFKIAVARPRTPATMSSGRCHAKRPGLPAARRVWTTSKLLALAQLGHE